MEYDQRYNQALGYMIDLYTDNHIVDCITVEQFKELFDMFIDSRKDIDNILYNNNTISDKVAEDICNSIRVTLSNIKEYC
ncbi:hypothetical protein [Clostridium sp. CTA-6]